MIGPPLRLAAGEEIASDTFRQLPETSRQPALLGVILVQTLKVMDRLPK